VLRPGLEHEFTGKSVYEAAFSVSGSFRRMLSELIAGLKGLRRPRQVVLFGEALSEARFSASSRLTLSSFARMSGSES